MKIIKVLFILFLFNQLILRTWFVQGTVLDPGRWGTKREDMISGFQELNAQRYDKTYMFTQINM